MNKPTGSDGIILHRNADGTLGLGCQMAGCEYDETFVVVAELEAAQDEIEQWKAWGCECRTSDEPCKCSCTCRQPEPDRCTRCGLSWIGGGLCRECLGGTIKYAVTTVIRK